MSISCSTPRLPRTQEVLHRLIGMRHLKFVSLLLTLLDLLLFTTDPFAQWHPSLANLRTMAGNWALLNALNSDSDWTVIEYRTSRHFIRFFQDNEQQS